MSANNEPTPTTRDTEVPNVPNDSVSSLSSGLFNDAVFLASGSWGNSASFWKVQPGHSNQVTVTPSASYAHSAPVLGCAISVENQSLFTGTVEGDGIMWNLVTGAQQPFMKTDGGLPIKTVKYLPKHNLVAVGSYDRTVRFWDVRTAPGNTAMKFNFSDRVTAFDASDNVSLSCIVAVGTKKYAWLDFRATTSPSVVEKDSPHVNSTHNIINTSAVGCMKTRVGGAIACIEGRVMIEDHTEPARSFPFRSHKRSENGQFVIHTITATDFNPRNDYFATAGTDGCFYFWDHRNKSRIRHYGLRSGARCISAATFSPDGAYYFYSNSYNWYRGYNDPLRHEQHKIFVHRMSNDDLPAGSK